MEQKKSEPGAQTETTTKAPWSTPRLYTEGKVVEITFAPIGSGL